MLLASRMTEEVYDITVTLGNDTTALLYGTNDGLLMIGVVAAHCNPVVGVETTDEPSRVV